MDRADYFAFCYDLEEDIENRSRCLKKKFVKRGVTVPDEALFDIVCSADSSLKASVLAGLQLIKCLDGKPPALKYEKKLIQLNLDAFRSKGPSHLVFVLYYLNVQSEEVINELVELSKLSMEEYKDKASTLLCNHFRIGPKMVPEEVVLMKDYNNHLVSKDLNNQVYIDRDQTFKAFCDHINSCAGTNSSQYYAPYFALIQRSGSGKTKLLYQVGKQKSFTCYIRLDGQNIAATPPEVVKFLKSISHPIFPDVDDKVAKDYIALAQYKALSFLYAIALYLVNFVQSHCKHDGTAHYSECFSHFFDGLATAEEATANWDSILKSAKTFKSMSEFRTVFGKFKDLNIDSFVIALDEARELLSGEGTVSPFQILRECLHYIWSSTNHYLVMVLIDTNSIISDFAIPECKIKSGSRFFHATGLFPPFYLLSGQDIKGSKYLIEAVRLFEEGKHLEFIKWRDSNVEAFIQIGCPRWAVFRGIGECLFCAKLKLQGATFPSPVSYLAALASRVKLKISADSDLARELMSGNMAQLNYLTEDRKQAFIGYPSDPMLAAAARDILMGKNKLKTHCFEILEEYSNRGLIDVGKAGVTVMQFLLMAAMDQATDLLIKASNRSTNFGLNSVTVKDLFGALFNEDLHEQIFASMPQNFWEGRTMFNHAISLTENANLNNVKFALIRGAILVGSHCQPGWDILICVVSSDGSIAYILIQVKNYDTLLDETDVDEWFHKSVAASAILHPEYEALKASYENEQKNLTENDAKDLEALNLENENPMNRPHSDVCQETSKRLQDDFQARVLELGKSSNCLHILVNFLQGAHDGEVSLDVSDADGKIVLQGPLSKSFRSFWAEGNNSDSRILRANAVTSLENILSNKEGYMKLLERSNNKHLKARFKKVDHSFVVNDFSLIEERLQHDIVLNGRD